MTLLEVDHDEGELALTGETVAAFAVAVVGFDRAGVGTNGLGGDGVAGGHGHHAVPLPVEYREQGFRLVLSFVHRDLELPRADARLAVLVLPAVVDVKAVVGDSHEGEDTESFDRGGDSCLFRGIDHHRAELGDGAAER